MHSSSRQKTAAATAVRGTEDPIICREPSGPREEVDMPCMGADHAAGCACAAGHICCWGL